MRWASGIRICTILALPIRVLCCTQTGFSMTELSSKARLLLFENSSIKTSTMVYSISAGYNTGNKYPYCIAYHVASIIHSIYSSKVRSLHRNIKSIRSKLDKSELETLVRRFTTKFTIKPCHNDISALVFKTFTEAIASFRPECDGYRITRAIHLYKTSGMFCILNQKLRTERYAFMLDDSDPCVNPYACNCRLEGDKARLRDTLISYWQENYIGADTVVGVSGKEASTFKNDLSTFFGDMQEVQNYGNSGGAAELENPLVRLLYSLARVEPKRSLYNISRPYKQGRGQEYVIPVIRANMSKKSTVLEINIEFPWDFPFFNIANEADFNSLCMLARPWCLNSILLQDELIEKLSINRVQGTRGMILSFCIHTVSYGVFDYKKAISEFSKYIDSLNFKDVKRDEIEIYNSSISSRCLPFIVQDYCLHAIASKRPNWELQLPNNEGQFFFDYDLYVRVFEHMKDRSYWRVFLVGNVLQELLPVHLYPFPRIEYQIDNVVQHNSYNITKQSGCCFGGWVEEVRNYSEPSSADRYQMASCLQSEVAPAYCQSSTSVNGGGASLAAMGHYYDATGGYNYIDSWPAYTPASEVDPYTAASPHELYQAGTYPGYYYHEQ